MFAILHLILQAAITPEALVQSLQKLNLDALYPIDHIM